jgi:hypothetical protein
MSGDDLLDYAKRNGGWVSSGPDAGSRECVPLVKHAIPELGSAKSDWRQGPKVTGPDDPNLKPGTAIGYGFDAEGRYPNNPHENHGAYVSKSPDTDGSPGTVIEQDRHTPAHERKFDNKYFSKHEWYYITRE